MEEASSSGVLPPPAPEPGRHIYPARRESFAFSLLFFFFFFFAQSDHLFFNLSLSLRE
jgi:hypothetical protein